LEKTATFATPNEKERGKKKRSSWKIENTVLPGGRKEGKARKASDRKEACRG